MSKNKKHPENEQEEVKNTDNQSAEEQKKTSSETDTQENGNEKQEQDTRDDKNTDNASEKEESSDDFESKYNEVNDKYLRLYSDFENFRRRSAREKMELIDNAGGEIIKEILPVIDDFERAINAEGDNQEQNKSVTEGINLVYQKLIKTLKAKGLKPMDNIGKDFDPEREEAVAKIPAPKKKMKGKVVDVVEKGYYLNDKILRHAKVVVGE